MREIRVRKHWTHNINFNKAIKCSPHFCVFGREPDVTGLFLDIESNLNPAEHEHKTASFLKKAHAAVKLAQAAADIRVVENSQIYHKPTKYILETTFILNAISRFPQFNPKLQNNA